LGGDVFLLCIRIFDNNTCVFVGLVGIRTHTHTYTHTHTHIVLQLL
jgi:hypothetical protein